jgi:hypothetical protein
LTDGNIIEACYGHTSSSILTADQNTTDSIKTTKELIRGMASGQQEEVRKGYVRLFDVLKEAEKAMGDAGLTKCCKEGASLFILFILLTVLHAVAVLLPFLQLLHPIPPHPILTNLFSPHPVLITPVPHHTLSFHRRNKKGGKN